MSCTGIRYWGRVVKPYRDEKGEGSFTFFILLGIQVPLSDKIHDYSLELVPFERVLIKF